MGKITIAALKPGMVLASDVKDLSGRLLIGRGVTLTEKHIRVFKIWGVVEADVEGISRKTAEEVASADIDPELLAAAESYTRSRFLHCDLRLECVAELMRCCAVRKARDVAVLNEGPEQLVVWKAPASSGSSGGVLARPREPLDPHALIQDEMRLGTLPVVFHRLVEAVNDSRSSTAEIADIIGNDTDLSARVLKLVNSAFYGLQSRVDTISRAVFILGSNQLVALAIGISVVTFFRGIPETVINMESFWRHSIAVGVGSRILASYHMMPNTERFFVAGLLHDLGRLVLFRFQPDRAREAFELAGQTGRLMHDTEQEVLGFSHDKLGGLLLKKWKFPVSLEKNVRYHHSPDKAPNRLEACILRLADILANAMEQGSSGERLVPPLTADVWDTLGMPLSIISQTAAQMDYQVDSIIRLFTEDGAGE